MLKNASTKDATKLYRALLLEIYEIEGPRDHRGAVLSVKKFAKITPEKIDKDWDFSNRHLMHRIAKALA